MLSLLRVRSAPARGRLRSAAARALVEGLEGRRYLASITGSVRDDTSGAGLAGAVVQLWDTDPSTGQPTSQLTDATTGAGGSYRFSSVPVSAPASGHQLAVTLVPQDGWHVTSPAGGATRFVAAPTQDQQVTTGVDWAEAPVPAAPTGLAAAAVSTSEIDLSWSGADAAAGVLVRRSADGGATWQAVTPAPLPAGAAAYNDTGLAEGTTYVYQVVAVDSSGFQSAPSDGAFADTLPLAPGSLSAAKDDTGDVVLNWADNSANADGYEVFCSTDGANFDLLYVLPAGAATYTDANPAYGQVNSYFVKATAGGAESDASNTASLTPDAPPAASDDEYSVLHDQALKVDGSYPPYGVLSNDSSAAGSPLSVAGATASSPLSLMTTA